MATLAANLHPVVALLHSLHQEAANLHFTILELQSDTRTLATNNLPTDYADHLEQVSNSSQLYTALEDLKQLEFKIGDLSTEIASDRIQAIQIPANGAAFDDLPAEMRSDIYELSGCLTLRHYRMEQLPLRGDDKGAAAAEGFDSLLPASSTSGRV